LDKGAGLIRSRLYPMIYVVLETPQIICSLKGISWRAMLATAKSPNLDFVKPQRRQNLASWRIFSVLAGLKGDSARIPS